MSLHGSAPASDARGPAVSDIGRDPIFRSQNERGAIETDDVQRLLSGIEPAREEIAPQVEKTAPVRAKVDLGQTFGPMVRLR